MALNVIKVLGGKKVLSDKEVQTDAGDTIIFTDGSVCVISSGVVVNKGEGEIKIIRDEGEDKKIEKTFAAARVKVIDIAADVSVIPHQKKTVEVSARGPELTIASIQITQEGDLVTITGGRAGGSSRSEVRGGTTTIIGNVDGPVYSGRFDGPFNVGRQRAGRSIVTAYRGGIACAGNLDGNVFITGSNNVVQGGCRGAMVISEDEAGEQIYIEVRVPIGAYVQMSGVSGQAVIGDTLGDVRLYAKEGKKISCGKVRNARATAEDYAEITIERITGDARFIANEYSRVTVSGGEIGKLEANADEYSHITVNASAQSADLDADEYSAISVTCVVEKPSRSVGEYSTISVGNW